MATKKPLVLTSGKIEEIQSGDTFDAGQQGISATNNTGSQIDKGSAVHLKNNAGTLEIELADASDNTKPCQGFAGADIPNTQAGVVIRDGVLDGFTGLTPASEYYLSETAGEITATAPTTSSAVVQHVGQAISATQIEIELDKEIRLA